MLPLLLLFMASAEETANSMGHIDRDEQLKKLKQCAQLAKYGAISGVMVGTSFGVVLAGVNALQYPGMRMKAFFRALPKFALGSGAGFGLFLTVGSIIRCM